MDHSLTEENYLKTILALSGGSDEVTVNELSQRLGIKMPTVTSMMKKLAEKKLVQYQSYKPLKLTEQGRQEASAIIRKHRLTEMFLVQVMGFGWEEVHEIAEQVEHVRSSHFFEKMDEMLGYPKIDPHGSPIPDKHGRMEGVPHKKLSEAGPGETVTLAAVLNSSADFLKYLNSRDLRLGTAITVRSVEAFDGSMIISYDDRPGETISLTVSDLLLVE
ncbi:metal-dependent transcriptional regulator [Paraflavisolibacter sp. H34]|uniref:metal-dependent transcriptional regulator n=1 Tax=Huijunlia imazamoxiresistens TaxID=3127457 RepID=UPI003019B7C2